MLSIFKEITDLLKTVVKYCKDLFFCPLQFLSSSDLKAEFSFYLDKSTFKAHCSYIIFASICIKHSIIVIW